MANLSITAANVLASGGAATDTGRAGATITAGQPVYLDATDNKLKLADSNGTAAQKAVKGIALNGASDGQPLAYIKEGDLVMGATLTPGARYYLGDTAGAIQPEADLATEDVILLGLAKSASVLAVKITIPGVTLA